MIRRKKLMKKIFSFLFYLFLLFLVSDCSDKKKIISDFDRRVSEISKQYIADKSLSVFSPSLKNIDNKWFIEGATTNAIVFTKLMEMSDSLFRSKKFTNNFMMLPDPALDNNNYAIVNVSVTPLREKPSHSSQMVDQTTMGNIIRLLRYKTGWYLSQTHYNYVGWINETGLFICDSVLKNNWVKNANYTINTLQTTIFSLPNNTSQPITDAVLNNILIGNIKNKDWVSILLPDGRSGYVTKNILKPIISRSEKLAVPDSILRDAYRMTGVPYLWGGNSSKGNDCSGFTQIVFKSNGIQLPRDARQQALEGIDITPDKNWENIRPGDLLFFGENNRVTHVGISTGGKEFIHQGGMVKENSLDKNLVNFAPKRLETFLFVKRII